MPIQGKTIFTLTVKRSRLRNWIYKISCKLALGVHGRVQTFAINHIIFYVIWLLLLFVCWLNIYSPGRSENWSKFKCICRLSLFREEIIGYTNFYFLAGNFSWLKGRKPENLHWVANIMDHLVYLCWIFGLQCIEMDCDRQF